MHKLPDSISITREFLNRKIVVVCYYMPRFETWSLSTKVNGQLVEHRQVTDPYKEAQISISNELAMVDDLETVGAGA